MANRFGRTQRKAGNGAARRRRLTVLPKADKLWLLAGTAIITGAVLWPTHPALADCAAGTNFLSCQDAGGVIEEDPQTFAPTADGFEVDVGVNNTVGTIRVDGAGETALFVNNAGSYDGDITVTEGSTIEASDIPEAEEMQTRTDHVIARN